MMTENRSKGGGVVAHWREVDWQLNEVGWLVQPIATMPNEWEMACMIVALG